MRNVGRIVVRCVGETAVVPPSVEGLIVANFQAKSKVKAEARIQVTANSASDNSHYLLPRYGALHVPVQRRCVSVKGMAKAGLHLRRATTA